MQAGEPFPTTKTFRSKIKNDHTNRLNDQPVLVKLNARLLLSKACEALLKNLQIFASTSLTPRVGPEGEWYWYTDTQATQRIKIKRNYVRKRHLHKISYSVWSLTHQNTEANELRKTDKSSIKSYKFTNLLFLTCNMVLLTVDTWSFLANILFLAFIDSFFF